MDIYGIFKEILNKTLPLTPCEGAIRLDSQAPKVTASDLTPATWEKAYGRTVAKIGPGISGFHLEKADKSKVCNSLSIEEVRYSNIS